MTESGIIQLATLVVGAFVTVMLAVIQRDQRAARKEAQEVKKTLQFVNAEKEKKIDTIHDLVNSTLGKEIREKMEALQELALHNPSKWQEKADAAARQFDDYTTRQVRADKRKDDAG